jgi:hypothetical protein
MSPAADLARKPLIDEELVFVTLVFLHLNTAYGAIRAGVLKEPRASPSTYVRSSRCPYPTPAGS